MMFLEIQTRKVIILENLDKLYEDVLLSLGEQSFVVTLEELAETLECC